MTTPGATPGQFLTAPPGIFNEEVLKPELKAPNDAIIAQKTTKGLREAFLESILKIKKDIKKDQIMTGENGDQLNSLPLLYVFTKKKPMSNHIIPSYSAVDLSFNPCSCNLSCLSIATNYTNLHFFIVNMLIVHSHKQNIFQCHSLSFFSTITSSWQSTIKSITANKTNCCTFPHQ